MKVLVVIDMQNDFIDGSLGTPEAVAIVPEVKALIDGFDGAVYFTRDTHPKDYLSTSEGKNLPVEHCIKGTVGWEISEKLDTSRAVDIIDKPTFGSRELADKLKALAEKENIESITFAGLCTDICVISNALLIKATLPETEIVVKASACAGVTPESHGRALEAMKMCQIKIL